MVPPCSDRMSRVPPYSRTTHQMSRKGLSPVMPSFPTRSAVTMPGHWPDPRSLATTDGVSLMSFPRGTEMFQFPRFAFGTYGFSSKSLPGPAKSMPSRPRRSRRLRRTERNGIDGSEVGFPIRKSGDQSLFAAPPGLSQRTTSFIASQRQGIHQTPL